MELCFLPPDDIVSVARKTELVTNQEVTESDFLLRALRLVNTSPRSVRITSYSFTFESKGIGQSSIILLEESVKKRSSEVSQVMGQLSREGSRLRKIQQKDNLHRLMGTDRFWASSRLADDNVLKPD